MSTSTVQRDAKLARPSTALLLGAVVALAIVLTSGRSSAAPSSPPATVTATELPTSSPSPFLPRGHRVRGHTLGVRMFVNARHGFALANVTKGGGATYPATTINKGKTWRVAGPEFHVAAANAPNVVTQVGAGGASTYFAYAGPSGGNSVEVSTDGGGHWWRAYLAGNIPAVVDNDGTLIAFTNSSGVYYSKSGGQTWHFATSVTAVP